MVQVVAVLRSVATERARCAPTPPSLTSLSTFSNHTLDTLDTLDTLTLDTLDDTLDSLNRGIAFAMGLEERLGAGSRVRWLDPEVLRMVLGYV